MHWFAALCPKIRLFCFRSQITPRPSKEEDNQALTFPEITNFYVVKRFIMGIKAQIAIWCLCLFQLGSSFKTGFESGLICYQCVGTHPGCGLHDFDWRWYWGKICPRSDDRCVKLIERKGSNVVVTRDCLSNLEGFRTDIPADKYEGCRSKSKDVKLGQYTFNRIKELDTKRNFYDNTTWCFCDFDHWCNDSNPTSKSNPILLFGFFFVTFVFSCACSKWL